MANNGNFYTRIQNKHDIEANWLKATNFIPLPGEIIIYDEDSNHDYQRMKIGDGNTNVNSLDFYNKPLLYAGDEEISSAEIINADTLGGKTESALSVAKAANADKLNNLTAQDIINKIYPIGSTYVTSTNSNPASYLGGTWNLVDKEFKSSYASSTNSYFTMNTTNTTSYTLYYIRSGHSLRIRMNIKNKVVLADSDLELGTIDLAALGVANLTYTFTQIPMLSDGGNGYAMTNIQQVTGVVSTSDALSPSGHSIAAGSSCWLEIPVVCYYDNMLDAFCDKFYWKRTA